MITNHDLHDLIHMGYAGWGPLALVFLFAFRIGWSWGEPLPRDINPGE
jgi:hypothetical protein